MASASSSSSGPCRGAERSSDDLSFQEQQTAFSWRPYWEEQERQWKQYDIASLACKMMLFFGNMVTQAYKQAHEYTILRVRVGRL